MEDWRNTMAEDMPHTLLEFPCEFPIKAFGNASDELLIEVIQIIERHSQPLQPDSISVRKSNGGKYDAISVSITATSKEQLDAIYQELTASPRVIMAL
jgi:putative lipoic acid-binding regulatory protein